MGQDISTAFNPPPLSLRQCFIDDKFSLPHYLIYRRRRNAANQRFQNMISLLNQRKKENSMIWINGLLHHYPVMYIHVL